MQNIDERKQIINEMIYEDEVFISKMDRLDEKGKEFLDNICREADKIAEQTLKLDDDEAYKYMAEQIKRAKKNIVKMLRKRSKGSAALKKKVHDDSDRIPEEEPNVITSDEPEDENDSESIPETIEPEDEEVNEPKYQTTVESETSHSEYEEENDSRNPNQPVDQEPEQTQDFQNDDSDREERDKPEQKHGKFYNKNKYHQYKKNNHHNSNSNYKHNDNRY